MWFQETCVESRLLLLQCSTCVSVCIHQGKSEFVNMISEELETHATVYQPPGHASNLPSFITNHGLLTQDRFLRLLHRAKVRWAVNLWHDRTGEDDYEFHSHYDQRSYSCLCDVPSSLILPSQVFVGLGFPYEGPAPIEAVALGCVLIQPRFDPPHSSDNNNFYKGKPTTRQVYDSCYWKVLSC